MNFEMVFLMMILKIEMIKMFHLQEHERNYTPSEWSIRNSDSTELLVNYFKFCTEGQHLKF